MPPPSPSSAELRSPIRINSQNGRAPWVVLTMCAMVVLPAALTLLRVAAPRPGIDPASNPTPLGYTFSLSLFIVPVVVLFAWLLPTPEYALARGAFWRTFAVLAPLGIVLDLLFGTAFFVFPNREATLGIEIPAVGGSVPVEEIVFYVTGFLVVLLLYIWGDEYWVRAYNIPDYRAESQQVPRLLQFDVRAPAIGVLLVAFAILYKKLLSGAPQGYPWYFIYLVAAAILPAVGLYRSVSRFINWRAFSLTFFFIVLVSVLWEATLAIPYGWWNYNREMMIGVFVDAWSELPLEAILVWLAVTYTSVILYEAMKIWRASGKPLREALVGHSRATDRER